MNDITKPFKAGIIKFDAWKRKLFELTCYIYPTIKNDEEFDYSNC